MQIQFISGPLSWYHFEVDTNKGNKTIHLFSDIHDFSNLCPKKFNCIDKSNSNRKTDCVEFDFFLEKIFKNAVDKKLPIDFFLESPYKLSNLENLTIDIPNLNYLDKIYHRFKSCFQRDKSKCKFLPYVRVNYTDIRVPDYKYSTIGSYIVEFYFVLLITVYMYVEQKISLDEVFEVYEIVKLIFQIMIQHAFDISSILLKKNNFEDLILKYFEPVLSIQSKSKLVNDIQTKLVKMLKRLFMLHKVRNGKRIFIVKHQLDELRKDKVKYQGILISDLIVNFFDEYTKLLSENAKDSNIKFLNLLNSKLETLNRKNAKQTFDWLWNQRSVVLNNNILFDSYYLDIYILARMFRTFGKSVNPMSIVYAGNLHIETQKDFFTLFLNVKPTHSETNQENQRCLSNYDFNQIFDLL